VVDLGCISDVLEDGTFENDAVFPALGYQPWEIDSCVYADGREGIGIVKTRSQFLLGYHSELET
jgi:hypothetical protein